MNIGDLVKITYTATLDKSRYSTEENKIAMIIEGPNEAGKIKVAIFQRQGILETHKRGGVYAEG